MTAKDRAGETGRTDRAQAPKATSDVILQVMGEAGGMDSCDSVAVEPTDVDHEGEGGPENDLWLLAGEPGGLL